MFKSSGRKKDFICASKSKSLRRRERGRSLQIINSFPFRKALLYSFFIYLLFKTILYKTWTRKVRLRTMNSRNSLKQWLTRRRVKDFFLAADGDNVGPRAQPVKPVALLEKPNFLNIASVEANPTNTQAHLPIQSNQSKAKVPCGCRASLSVSVPCVCPCC